MTRANRKKLWHLAERQQVLLDDAQGTALRVARGTLWITLERDTRDIILSTGETFHHRSPRTDDRRGTGPVDGMGRGSVRPPCVRA